MLVRVGLVAQSFEAKVDYLASILLDLTLLLSFVVPSRN